jgi:hypothetical protein
MASTGIVNGVISSNLDKPGASRIGFTLASGVFSIVGANGIALSDTNPAFATLPDQSSLGIFKNYVITAGWSFKDLASGASEITGNQWRTTSGLDYAVDKPFYVYLVANDAQDTLMPMLCDLPHFDISPAAAAIGAPDDAVADSQGDFWAFDNIDETLYESNPCICIGAIRMQKTGASDDWTIQTIATYDGVGRFLDDRDFSVPAANYGAATGSFIVNNATGGEDEAIFSTQQMTYIIQRTGYVEAHFNGATINNTPAGTVALKFISPFENGESITHNYANGYWVDASASSASKLFRYSVGNLGSGVEDRVTNFIIDGGTAVLLNGALATGDSFRMNWNFQASRS